MRYFYDTEFIENGRTIGLISIGIVAQDGRELYLINEEAQQGGALYEQITRHEWLMDHVVPHLPGAKISKHPDYAGGYTRTYFLDDTDNRIVPRRMIRNAVRDFLLHDGGHGELWADYGAYDHVALAQLFGPMINLPDGIPMFTNEFQQVWRARGCPTLPKQATGLHDALEDARHLAACWQVVHRPSEWQEPRAKPETTWQTAGK